MGENKRKKPVSKCRQMQTLPQSIDRDGLCAVVYWKVSTFQWYKIIKILVFWEILLLTYPISN